MARTPYSDALAFLESRRGNDVAIARRMDFPRPGGLPPIPSPGGDPGAQLGAPRVELQNFKVLQAPWIEKLGPISRDFNANDYAMTLAAAIGATATSANLRFQVPQSQVGWCQEMELYILAPTATSRVTWTLRINQGPVSGFDNLQIPPGAANLILITKNDLRVRVPEGALVDVLITNGAAQAETVGGRIAGWYHPRVAEETLWGPV